MRITLQALGRTTDFGVVRDAPDENAPPGREPDVFSTTERASGWDHDMRVPIGFRHRRG